MNCDVGGPKALTAKVGYQVPHLLRLVQNWS